MYIKSQQLVIAVLTAQRFSFQFSNNDNIIVSTGRMLYVAVCVRCQRGRPRNMKCFHQFSCVEKIWEQHELEDNIVEDEFK